MECSIVRTILSETTNGAMETLSFSDFQQMFVENKFNKSLRLLILDSRPYISYNDGHIVGAKNMYCPPISKRRFANGGKLHLEKMLDSETRHRLTSGSYSHIVIYGENEDEVLHSDSNVNIVWHSIQQLGFGGICQLLKGGFAQFEQRFPLLCTSADDTSINNYPPEPTAQEKSQRHALFRTNSTLTDPVEIFPHLYIGNALSAASMPELQRLGITAILNVSSTCKNHFTKHFVYKNIPVDDNHSTELSEWFTDTNSFIDEVKGAGGRTLVHCHAGVSRSATICIAYVMYSRNISLDAAFEFVKSRRSEISPNAGFMHQLLEFEKELAEKNRRMSPLTPPSSPPCRFFSVSSSFCSSMDTSVSSPFTTPFSSPTALSSPMVAFT
ncbi:dual specificity protein phosphatase 4-like [Saccostrea echinata]|uniref:dual specificity protein phosphatase 4-like n=1 Tax=Saccostrea echinata TaxID=191078 RepID=UPI002A83BEFB|nr:dual specificity protein phosphatase 4-like [Saccostrea echinata]